MKKILLLISLGILLATLVTPAYSSDHKEKLTYDGLIDHDEWHEYKAAQGYKHVEKE